MGFWLGEFNIHVCVCVWCQYVCAHANLPCFFSHSLFSLIHARTALQSVVCKKQHLGLAHDTSLDCECSHSSFSFFRRPFLMRVESCSYSNLDSCSQQNMQKRSRASSMDMLRRALLCQNLSQNNRSLWSTPWWLNDSPRFAPGLTVVGSSGPTFQGMSNNMCICGLCSFFPSASCLGRSRKP